MTWNLRSVQPRRGLLCLGLLALLPIGSGNSQPQYNSGQSSTGGMGAQYPQAPQVPVILGDGNRSPKDSMQQQEELKRLKALNVLRQKELTSDSAKLLALANDLQSEIGKSEKHPVPTDAVRKAELIEKLAKNVRNKMTETIGN